MIPDERRYSENGTTNVSNQDMVLTPPRSLADA